MSDKHDVSGVVSAFLNHQIPERAELMRYFRQEVLHSEPCVHLVREIGDEAFRAGLSPARLIQLVLIYGKVLGVLEERELQKRKRRRN